MISYTLSLFFPFTNVFDKNPFLLLHKPKTFSRDKRVSTKDQVTISCNLQLFLTARSNATKSGKKSGRAEDWRGPIVQTLYIMQYCNTLIYIFPTFSLSDWSKSSTGIIIIIQKGIVIWSER